MAQRKKEEERDGQPKLAPSGVPQPERLWLSEEGGRRVKDEASHQPCTLRCVAFHQLRVSSSKPTLVKKADFLPEVISCQ